MKHILIVFITLFVFVLLLVVSESSAQNFTVGFDGGPIGRVFGESKQWNTGYTIGGHIFYNMTSIWSIGGIASYNSQTPNEKEVIAARSRDAYWTCSGSSSFFEVAPSIRYTLPNKTNDWANLFGQAGIGFVKMDVDANAQSSTTEVVGEDDQGDPITQTVVTDDPMGKSGNYLGLNIGGGVALTQMGKRFELSALFHLILTENKATKLFKLNLSMGFLK